MEGDIMTEYEVKTVVTPIERLFNALVLYDYNVRILHWKVKGMDFGTKHELMDEYHSKLNEFIDDIGEVLMLNNINGFMFESLRTLIEKIENDQDYIYTSIDGKRYYTSEEVIKITSKMFGELIILYDNVMKDPSITEDVISKLQEHQYYLRKERQYKLNSTLK